MNVTIFAFGITNLVIGITLLNMIFIPMIKCKTLVYGTCAGLETVHGYRGVTLIYPNFEYEFGGNKYRERSLFSIKPKMISLYSYGMTRTIWIDENNPKRYIVRRLSAMDLFLRLLGVVFVFISGGFTVCASIFFIA